jgi:hypothetical protein
LVLVVVVVLFQDQPLEHLVELMLAVVELELFLEVEITVLQIAEAAAEAAEKGLAEAQGVVE